MFFKEVYVYVFPKVNQKLLCRILINDIQYIFCLYHILQSLYLLQYQEEDVSSAIVLILRRELYPILKEFTPKRNCSHQITLSYNFKKLSCRFLT